MTSTRMTSAAFCSTRSGTVSRTATPVMRDTTSARLSRCWMLSAVQTSMPASSSSSTSCQRLGCRLSGALVCASSSTTTSLGLRASAASMSNSSRILPRYSILRRGRISRPSIRASVSRRPWVSARPIDDIDAIGLQGARPGQHCVGLADAGGGAQEDAQLAAFLPVRQRQKRVWIRATFEVVVCFRHAVLELLPSAFAATGRRPLEI